MGALVAEEPDGAQSRAFESTDPILSSGGC